MSGDFTLRIERNVTFRQNMIRRNYVCLARTISFTAADNERHLYPKPIITMVIDRATDGLNICYCYVVTYDSYNNELRLVMGDLRKLSWALEENEKERLLDNFLTDAQSRLMQNCFSRHTTIIAPNNRLLRAAAPIFKDRPYFAGTNSKVLVQTREYGNRNCVFVFIDTIDYDYLATLFNDLPSDYNTKVQVVSTRNLLQDEVKMTLDIARDKSMENVIITYLENNEFKAFQVYAFTSKCKREVRLSYVWVPDKGLETYHYDDYSPRNLNKCPVPISTLLLEDAISLRNKPDGTLHVSGGPEGNLILTFAEKLNFTAAVKYPEIHDWDGFINNTVIGLLGEIANRKSLIAFGQLRPTVKRHKFGDFTTSYGHVCIVWTTPVITTCIADILYTELPTCIWAAIVVSIALSCIFVYNLSRNSSNSSQRQTYIAVTLDVLCATLGTSIQRFPPNRPGKLFFLSYIFYAMVVTVAYRTSLASLLTVRHCVQVIKNDEDIVRLGLATGGSNSILSILRNQQQENSQIPYLIEHYEIIPDVATALDRIKHKKDLAYIRHLSTMQYYKRNLTLSGENVYFYSFDECIISYHAVAFVLKGSALTDELNRIMRSILESGFMDTWNIETGNIIPRNWYGDDGKMEKLTLSQLQSIFMLYLSGISLSSLIMVLEMILDVLLKQKLCSKTFLSF